MLGAVFAHPRDHVRDIVIGSAPVVRGDAHPAVRGEPMEQVARSHPFAAEQRMEMDEHRTI